MPRGIRLNFSSRTVEGDDLAGLLREALPDADITARMDDSGAVVGYALELHFPDEDATTEAAFYLAEFFREHNWPVEYD